MIGEKGRAGVGRGLGSWHGFPLPSQFPSKQCPMSNIRIHVASVRDGLLQIIMCACGKILQIILQYCLKCQQNLMEKMEQ